MPTSDIHREAVAVDLTDTELREKISELRELLQQINRMEADHKAAKETMKGEMAELQARYQSLLDIVTSGRVERMMDIRTIYDLDTRTVSQVREDTGVPLPGRIRPMTDPEYVEEKARRAQAELPCPEAPQPGDVVTVNTGAQEAPAAGAVLLKACEACGHDKDRHCVGKDEAPGEWKVVPPGEGRCDLCGCAEYVPFAARVAEAAEAVHAEGEPALVQGDPGGDAVQGDSPTTESRR